MPASAVFVSDGLYQAAAASGTVAVTASSVVPTPAVGTGQGMPWVPAALLMVSGSVITGAARRPR